MSLLGFKKTFGEIEDACMQPTRLLSLTDSLCVVATCRKMHLLNLHQEKQLGNKLNEDITRVRLHTGILKEITTNHTSIQSLCMLRTNEEGKFSIASVDEWQAIPFKVVSFAQQWVGWPAAQRAWRTQGAVSWQFKVIAARAVF